MLVGCTRVCRERRPWRGGQTGAEGSRRGCGAPASRYRGAGQQEATAGALALCPTIVSMSTPSSDTSTGTLPRLCAASVCISTPRARAKAASSAMGCTDPTSATGRAGGQRPVVEAEMTRRGSRPSICRLAPGQRQVGQRPCLRLACEGGRCGSHVARHSTAIAIAPHRCWSASRSRGRSPVEWRQPRRRR